MSDYLYQRQEEILKSCEPSTEAEACTTGEVGGAFCTPELPRGKHLRLNILSTWGDKHYVGLTGIEVFTDTGEKAVIKEVKWCAFVAG